MRPDRHSAFYSRPRLCLVIGLFGLGFVAILARLTVVQVGQYGSWQILVDVHPGGWVAVAPVRGPYTLNTETTFQLPVSRRSPFLRYRTMSESPISRRRKSPVSSLTLPRATSSA